MHNFAELDALDNFDLLRVLNCRFVMFMYVLIHAVYINNSYCFKK